MWVKWQITTPVRNYTVSTVGWEGLCSLTAEIIPIYEVVLTDNIECLVEPKRFNTMQSAANFHDDIVEALENNGNWISFF